MAACLWPSRVAGLEASTEADVPGCPRCVTANMERVQGQRANVNTSGVGVRA